MIVLQTTTSQWYQAVKPDAQAPSQFFTALRDREATDRTASKSTWVEVQPIEGMTAFGPDLERAWVKLEHVSLFGLVKA